MPYWRANIPISYVGFLNPNVYFRNRMSVSNSLVNFRKLLPYLIILWMVATFPPPKGLLKACKSWEVYHLLILSAGAGFRNPWTPWIHLQLILGCTCGRQSHEFLLGKFQGLCEPYGKSWEGYEEIPEKVWKIGYMLIIDGFLEQIPSPSKLLKAMNQCNFLPITITKPNSYCPQSRMRVNCYCNSFNMF